MFSGSRFLFIVVNNSEKKMSKPKSSFNSLVLPYFLCRTVASRLVNKRQHAVAVRSVAVAKLLTVLCLVLALTNFKKMKVAMILKFNQDLQREKL